MVPVGSVTGRFHAATEAGSNSPVRRLAAEFRRTESEDDTQIDFTGVAGSVLAEGSETAQSLEKLSFREIQSESGGRVVVQWEHTYTELSGCRFNLAALKRMRGQEFLPLVALRH